MISEKKKKQFKILIKPIMKFLKKNFHAHATIVINSNHAELLDGESIICRKKEKANIDD
jgi:hypothetical protein